jgi:endonuclease G
MKWQAVSLARLRDLAGINAFPGAPAKAQDRAMRLPDPTPHDLGGSCAPGTAVATAAGHRTEGARAARSTARGAGSGGTLSLVLAGVVAVVLCFLLYRALGRR